MEHDFPSELTDLLERMSRELLVDPVSRAQGAVLAMTLATQELRRLKEKQELEDRIYESSRDNPDE
jgi:hypothetical protein